MNILIWTCLTLILVCIVYGAGVCAEYAKEGPSAVFAICVLLMFILLTLGGIIAFALLPIVLSSPITV